MTGFVYAYGNAEIVKIGFTNDPRRRVAHLKTGNAVKCELIGYVPATVEQEQEAHNLLASYRAHGEWFRREGPVETFCTLIARPAATKPRALVFGVGLDVVAKATGVHRSCVSKWSRRGVPIKHLRAVEEATGISRHVLRPDVFGVAA